jgi:hypothetical protein
MPQGVSYVQISVVYIRNIMPGDMAVPSRRYWPYRGGAMCYSLECLEWGFSEVRYPFVTNVSKYAI